MNEEWGSDIFLPADFVRPLISKLNLAQGRLTEALRLPAGTGRESAAAEWWQGRADDEQESLETALAGLAAPLLLADIGLLAGEAAALATTAVITAKQADEPAFLVGRDESGGQLRLRIAASRQVICDWLLAELDPAALIDAKLSFQVSETDFAALLAIADLYRRTRYVAMLDHVVPAEGFRAADIAISWREGRQSADVRWLMPFFATRLALPEPDGLPAALSRLASLGLIEFQDESSVALTEAGELLVSSLCHTTGRLWLAVTGADEDGRLAGHRAFFLRGEGLLWYVDAGETILVTTVDGTMAGKLLTELLTPVGTPATLAAPPKPAAAPPPAPPVEAATVCQACGGEVKPGAKFCRHCGKAMPTAGPASCKSCGRPLTAGDRFCNECGASV